MVPRRWSECVSTPAPRASSRSRHAAPPRERRRRPGSPRPTRAKPISIHGTPREEKKLAAPWRFPVDATRRAVSTSCGLAAALPFAGVHPFARVLVRLAPSLSLARVLSFARVFLDATAHLRRLRSRRLRPGLLRGLGLFRTTRGREKPGHRGRENGCLPVRDHRPSPSLFITKLVTRGFTRGSNSSLPPRCARRAPRFTSPADRETSRKSIFSETSSHRARFIGEAAAWPLSWRGQNHAPYTRASTDGAQRIPRGL